jgi:signal transduction histidine kinase
MTRDRRPLFVREEARLLAQVVRVAAEPAELRTLVEQFAQLVMDTTEAWRATVFLIDLNRLVLWANATRELSDDTRRRNWDRAFELGGIDLDEVPARKELFELGLPIPIPDARASDLVPDEWVDSFGLGALVVCPLVAEGEPLGLLVADWPDRHVIENDTVEIVGGIAGSLSLTVHNIFLRAREAERADALQSLLEATTVLRSSEGLEDLAGKLVQPLARALGATGVSICLLEDGGPRYRTLAGWNSAIDKRGSLRDVGRPLQARIATAWRDDPRPLVVTADELASLAPQHREGPVVALPLVATEGTLLGFVLVTLHEKEPTDRAVELAAALTSHLAAAVERAGLQEMLALETERLRGLCALWGFEADALEAYSAAIEEAIGPALGFTVVRVSVDDPDLRALGYFDEPDELDGQLIARWRRRRGHREPLPACDPKELAAPLSVSGRVVGVVRARARHGGISQREAEMLDALATAFGRAIEQEAARRDSRQRELDLALSEERERVAARLHDTVGRLLYALTLRSGTLRLAAGDSVLAEESRQIEALARSGLGGLRRAVATLASMRIDDDQGLLPSLERLAADFQDAHETAISLAVDGGEKALPVAVEEALFSVAREALANVERHARARNVTIALDLRDDEVVLRVSDDGLGFGRSDAPAGTRLGLELARRALEPVGGVLDLSDSQPGVEVVARVPLAPVAVRIR